MTKKPTVYDAGKLRHCLDVLQAVQKDSRTAGWYQGEVRGKEAVGAATEALLRAGLIQSAVGPQPFRLTKKGREFIAAHVKDKDWAVLMAKLDQPGTAAKVAKALEVAGR